MPLILPGVISGALFAFITSFDEVVVVMFMASLDELTIPKQMWAGIRQEISPSYFMYGYVSCSTINFFINNCGVITSSFRKNARHYS